MQDPLNILVVDDECSIRDTLQGILEDRGDNVSVAENGYTAIEMAKKTHFDIVFIDVVMPGIDGFQTLEEIKKIDPEIKIVLMTGRDIENLVEKATSRGASTCIPKPLDDVNELLQLLQTIKEGTVRTVVLVVNCEFYFSETLKKILDKNGCKAYVAEDGHSAIQMVKETHFDIVLIDVMSPGIDGLQTLEDIKNIDPATNVIMMTDHDIEDFTNQAVSRGAFANITKPVDLVRLLQLTINAIEKNRK